MPRSVRQFPFAPLHGQPFRLSIVTERPVSKGGPERFALEYRAEFYELGRGNAVSATLLAIAAPQRASAGGALARKPHYR